MSPIMNAKKTAVLATLSRYFHALSNTAPPLTTARSMVIGDAVRVIQPGADMPPSFYTMNQTLDILEDRIRQTPGIAENFVDPEPEVWVHDDLAFIFTGSEQSVNSVGQRRGVHVFAMLRDPELGDEQGWRIAGVTTVARTMDENLPPVVRDADSEVALTAVESVRRLLTAMSRQHWEDFRRVFHSDMGATISTGSWPPLTVDLESLLDRVQALVASFPAGAAFAEEIHDVEVRICGDLAVIWAPFVVIVDGTIKSRGVKVIRSIRLEGQWKIVGFTESSRLA